MSTMTSAFGYSALISFTTASTSAALMVSGALIRNASTLPVTPIRLSLHPSRRCGRISSGVMCVELLFFLLILAAWSLRRFYFWLRRCIRKARRDRARARRYQAMTEQIQQTRERYQGLSRNEIARMSGMPDDTVIGEDGLPHGTGEHDQYIFYVTRNNNIYHAKNGCVMTLMLPCNAAELLYRAPCRRCHPVCPDLSWYNDYRRTIARLHEYGVDPS